MTETEKESLKILDKLPYMSLLCKRIDDIDNAINRGQNGVDQAENLLSDLTSSWREELLPKIQAKKTKAELDFNVVAHNGVLSTNTRENKKLNIWLDYTRFIKISVLDMMDKNNMLFVVRSNVPESEFVDMHDQKEKEE